jgi:hypothetical protein
VHYLDFDRHLIWQRNHELLREVQKLRLKERLQTNRGPRSGQSRANNLTCQGVLSLARGARPSE